MRIVVFAALCVGVFSVSVQDGNQFLDTVLRDKLQTFPNLDPMNAPGRYVKLGNFIRSDWTANVKNVQVTGLSKVRRSGDCAEAKALPSGRVVIQCSLSLDALAVQFTSEQSYLGGRPNVIGVTAAFPPHLVSLHAEIGARRYPEVRLTLRSNLDPTLSYTNLGGLIENRAMKYGYSYVASDTLRRLLQKEYVDNLAEAMTGVPLSYGR